MDGHLDVSRLQRGRRTTLALWLDVSLLILFLVALAPHLTGLALHEIVGVTFCIPLLVHLLLSWQWIAAGVRRLFVSGTRRQRVNIVLNAVLFALTVVMLVAGLMISQVVLPALGIHTVDDSVWRIRHNTMVTWVHLSIGLHLAMNWRWIASMIGGRLPVRLRVRQATEEAKALE